MATLTLPNSLIPIGSGRYAAVVGYSQRVGPDTVFLTNFVRQQELELGRTSNLVEVGLRRQLTPLKVISLGLGAGISNQSPDLRATLGYQQPF